MENRRINEIEAIPKLGGPHLKICECGCELKFFGRLNQKYLNLDHKSKVNNQIRSELNKPLKDALHQMKVNYRLLEKFYGISNGKKIKFSQLLASGFDLNSYFKQVKLSETEKPCRRLEDYVFYISEDFTEITIFKPKK